MHRNDLAGVIPNTPYLSCSQALSLSEILVVADFTDPLK